jgi:hypothetical protein
MAKPAIALRVVDVLARGVLVKFVSVLFALFLVACGPLFETPVSILTADPAVIIEADNGCPVGAADIGTTDFVAGQLVADPTYGTVIIDVIHRMVDFGNPIHTMVAWPPGFTARWHANQVRVFDPQGNLVAETRQKLRLDGGDVNPATWGIVPTAPGAWFLACRVSEFAEGQ